jgi:hypothetical protein
MKVCGFSRGKAFNLLNNNQKAISLNDISTLCEMLFCTPNDLYYWENTASKRLSETHPCITQLSPPGNLDNWQLMLKKLTPDKISELYRQAENFLNEK